MPGYESRVEDESVLVVTVTRPDRRNALDLATATALQQHLLAADRDATIRAVLVTAAGSDFCTGADVAGAVPSTSPIEYQHAVEPFERLFATLWELETPVVAAVNGTVAGIGWLLALLADLVVAARSARWTHVFSRRGMVPHAGDTYYLPRILGLHRLTELAMLSDPVSSETLASWGVVQRVVENDEVWPTALALGRRLAEGPTAALGMTKRLYRHSLEMNLHTALAAERAAIALASTTEDRAEGGRAFAEKRPPRFQGR
jgi:2-(1,2-epoxy-1,2-dihydrophenyl)acetyl-CoA isomerase